MRSVCCTWVLTWLPGIPWAAPPAPHDLTLRNAAPVLARSLQAHGNNPRPYPPMTHTPATTKTKSGGRRIIYQSKKFTLKSLYFSKQYDLYPKQSEIRSWSVNNVTEVYNHLLYILSIYISIHYLSHNSKVFLSYFGNNISVYGLPNKTFLSESACVCVCMCDWET